MPTNHEANSDLAQKLDEMMLKIQNLTDEEDEVRRLLSIERAEKREIEKSLKEIDKEIDKNYGALKVKNFGAAVNSSLSDDNCPTCKQQIKDALLPSDITAIPMSIEDNISYLKG